MPYSATALLSTVVYTNLSFSVDFSSSGTGLDTGLIRYLIQTQKSNHIIASANLLFH